MKSESEDSEEVQKNKERDYYKEEIMKIIELHKVGILEKVLDFLKQNQPQEASDFILNNYPGSSMSEDPLALLLMGYIQICLNDLDSAQEYFLNAQRLDSKFKDYISDSIGIVFFLKKNYEEAIKNFEAARTLNNENDSFLLHVALSLEAIVLENEKKLAKMNESDSVENENEDELHEETLKAKAKIKEFYNEIIERNPECFEALYNLGMKNAVEGLLTNASRFFAKAAEIMKDNCNLLSNLGKIFYHEKDYKLSAEYFEKVINTNDKFLSNKEYVLYMISLFKNQSWNKLISVSKDVLRKDRKNKKALFYLLEGYKHTKKYNEMIKLLKKIKKKLTKFKLENSIDVKDTSNELSVHFDKLYKKIKKYYLDIKHELKKMRVKGNSSVEDELMFSNKEEISQLGKFDLDTCTSLGYDYKEIRKIINMYKSDNNNLESLFMLGSINFQEKEYDKAETFLLKLFSLNPDYNIETTGEYLGDIFNKKKNDPEKAIFYYNKSLVKKENELLYVKIGTCYELLKDDEKALKYYMKGYEKNNIFASALFHIGCLYDKKDDPEAKKWLEMAYENEKENVIYLQKYGDYLVRSKEKNDINKGVIILEKGIEFFMGNVDVMGSLAIGYEKNGKVKEAIKMLELANNDISFRQNESKMFQLALYYEEDKNLPKAIECYKNVLKVSPENKEALLHMAYLYKNCFESIKSFKCFKKILCIDPHNDLALYGLGRLYQISNEHDTEAVAYFKKALEVNPNHFKANLNLGIELLKLKKYEESLIYLNNALKIEPKNVKCLNALAAIYCEQKKFEEAEKYILEGLSIDKNNILLIGTYGDCLYGLKRVDEAISQYHHIIKLGITNLPEVYFSLGNCYLIKEKYDHAIQNFTSALKLTQNSRDDYYYYLGNALMAGNKVKEALKAFQAAIKIRPSKPEYYLSLAKGCFLEKLYSQTLKNITIFNLILDKVPKYKEKFDVAEIYYLTMRSSIELKKIDGEKFENFSLYLIQKDPKNFGYIECRAIILEYNKKYSEAIEYFEKVLKIEPNNEDALQSIERIKRKIKKQDLGQDESDSASSSNE